MAALYVFICPVVESLCPFPISLTLSTTPAIDARDTSHLALVLCEQMLLFPDTSSFLVGRVFAPSTSVLVFHMKRLCTELHLFVIHKGQSSDLSERSSNDHLTDM